jgi:glutamate--cysteine ligase
MTNNILDTLKALNDARSDDIERWMIEKRKIAAPYFYNSVDLRHSGLKIAPVDTNIFPAGFNNLSPAGRARASRFIARLMQEDYPDAKRIVIIPENHTRNLGYLENLATLLSLFETIGMEVHLGSLVAESGSPVEVEAPSGRKLMQYAIKRSGDRLVLDNRFDPDIIIMNNDMTAGSPPQLEGIAQPILPPVGVGWYRRRKSVHFEVYKELIDDFGGKFGIDPWLLNAEFHRCGLIDFKERTGIDALADGIEKVLSRVREKYKRYGITEEPYVFIKAESGTYGMGIMTARSADDIRELNKKDRNKMQVIKEGERNSEVIIQEGIPTIDLVNDRPAEPMIYMIDGVPVGGMYRVNSQRDAFNNLNASGMEFTGMCDETEEMDCEKWKNVQNCHFRSFGIIAAIAALAAARENYEKGVYGDGI